MKTARFSNIVEKCGDPEAYLLLTDPAKDKTFQAAVKAKRVMTVMQESVGTKTDRGEVGFHPGRGRQFLLFPKSLAPFADRSVVGIKYDLLKSSEENEPKGAKPRAESKPAKSRPKKSRATKATPTPKPNVVAFTPPADPEDDGDEIAALKNQVRRAMALLEEGKAVAAFNHLKRIVG